MWVFWCLALWGGPFPFQHLVYISCHLIAKALHLVAVICLFEAAHLAAVAGERPGATPAADARP